MSGTRFKKTRMRAWFLALGTAFCFQIQLTENTAAQSPITALAITPAGDQIVSGSQAGIAIQNWPALTAAGNFGSDMGQIQDLQFSPDGNRLLIAGGRPSEFGQWQIVDWPSLKVIASSRKHADVIYSVVWLSNEQFVSGAADNEVHHWQLINDDSSIHHDENDQRVRIVRQLQGHSRDVIAVDSVGAQKMLKNDSESGSDRLLVSAGLDHSIRVWNAGRADTTSFRILDNHTDVVRDLAIRPGEHSTAFLASASADKTVRIWQPTIGRLVRFARLPTEPLCIAWSADGEWIGAGCIDGTLRIINANTVQVEQRFNAIDGWAYCIAASPDGSFAVGGTNGVLKRVVVQPAAGAVPP